VLGGADAALRSHYRKQAEYHAAEFARLNVELLPAREFKRELGYFPGCALTQGVIERECERADWHFALKSKYQVAALHPWLLIASDPPEPK
jgi:hypothetical protein